MARQVGAKKGSGKWFSRKTPLLKQNAMDTLYKQFRIGKDKYLISGRKNPTVRIAYLGPYAMYVHENLAAHHPIGQAKFLEIAVRQHSTRMARYVADALQLGMKLEQALLRGAEIVLAESKKLVPVDTGFLKASGHTKIEK